ncbi:MAG TPA: hypothetical protein VMG12_02140 [Polyangiaceae bacterium]|nr:hypothetical protein [Polyangiaceae bacterium]
MRFDPWMLGLFFGAAGLVACGGDPSNAEDTAGDATGDGETSTEPHFEIEGRADSSTMSTVLDVVEGEESSRLAITSTDADANVIAIYVTFHGLDTVVGSHVFPISTVVDAEVFSVGSLDGRVYQSESGELHVNISDDWHSEGEFEMTLALDETTPPAAGAPAPTTPPPAELTLVGSFSSEWRVNCRSYISGFTGGHAVSDSPFCQMLTF